MVKNIIGDGIKKAGDGMKKIGKNVKDGITARRVAIAMSLATPVFGSTGCDRFDGFLIEHGDTELPDRENSTAFNDFIDYVEKDLLQMVQNAAYSEPNFNYQAARDMVEGNVHERLKYYIVESIQLLKENKLEGYDTHFEFPNDLEKYHFKESVRDVIKELNLLNTNTNNDSFLTDEEVAENIYNNVEESITSDIEKYLKAYGYSNDKNLNTGNDSLKIPTDSKVDTAFISDQIRKTLGGSVDTTKTQTDTTTNNYINRDDETRKVNTDPTYGQYNRFN